MRWLTRGAVREVGRRLALYRSRAPSPAALARRTPFCLLQVACNRRGVSGERASRPYCTSEQVAARGASLRMGAVCLMRCGCRILGGPLAGSKPRREELAQGGHLLTLGIQLCQELRMAHLRPTAGLAQRSEPARKLRVPLVPPAFASTAWAGREGDPLHLKGLPGLLLRAQPGFDITHLKGHEFHPLVEPLLVGRRGL